MFFRTHEGLYVGRGAGTALTDHSCQHGCPGVTNSREWFLGPDQPGQESGCAAVLTCKANSAPPPQEKTDLNETALTL